MPARFRIVTTLPVKGAGPQPLRLMRLFARVFFYIFLLSGDCGKAGRHIQPRTRAYSRCQAPPFPLSMQNHDQE